LYMSKLTDGKIKSAEISIKKSSPKTTMSKRPAAQKKKVLEDIHNNRVSYYVTNTTTFAHTMRSIR